MSSGGTSRPVARARAEAYDALAQVFRAPSSGNRELARVIAALARVTIWHAQPGLEEEVGALRRWLQRPTDQIPEEDRTPDASGLETFMCELECMANLCAREARAWEANDGGAAWSYLLRQRSHLRSLDLSLSGAAQANRNDSLYAILTRVAREYVAVDRGLVGAMLVAAEHAAPGVR